MNPWIENCRRFT